MNMTDNEQPHQELVKCVVVGDTAVGKTRLICARACNKQVSLSQLLITHVPTVWAIDQYRMCKDVLERSCDIVDGVNVSIRLWDTFGDHEKDRRFAYGKSDVVLLCFSLTNRNSLRNCKVMWYPEIRQFCPNTPIILVGCKNDLRYMYYDDVYLRSFRDRSPFVRPVRKADLVMPEEARSIAKELGMYYYEASVLTYYGVNEVFENAIRAALISRRNQRFWITNLKKIQRPLLQVPYCPPKPATSPVHVASSTFSENLRWLYQHSVNTDVVFIVGNVGFSAHRFILSAASQMFYKLFVGDKEETTSNVGRSISESSVVSTAAEAPIGEFNEDSEFLIRYEKQRRTIDAVKRRSSCQILNSDYSYSQINLRKPGFVKELKHPAFASINIEECDGSNHNCTVTYCLQTIITANKVVTPPAMAQCLEFIYTGRIDSNYTQLEDLKHIAQMMELTELTVFITNVQSESEYLNIEVQRRYKRKLKLHLREIYLDKGLFSDVLFQLDDGLFSAHKAVLSARCDVMRAMFSGDFKEKNSKVVFFPGVSLEIFYHLLVFLYKDEIIPISWTKCVYLIELANRLCLPRLIHLVEKQVIDDLSKISNGIDDAIQPCLILLEPCKLHNAEYLADWCMNYLCVNYNVLCKMSPKLLKALHPENQDYLMENRWPPVWYLKDFDYYMKRAGERQKEDKLLFKRGSGRGTKCLCFNGNNDDKISPEQIEPTTFNASWTLR